MNRGEKLLAAVSAFGMAMDELGIAFAGVTLDETKQTVDATTVGYCGNVGRESGVLMMKTFLAIKAHPEHELSSCILIHEQTGLTQ